MDTSKAHDEACLREKHIDQDGRVGSFNVVGTWLYIDILSCMWKYIHGDILKSPPKCPIMVCEV